MRVHRHQEANILELLHSQLGAYLTTMTSISLGGGTGVVVHQNGLTYRMRSHKGRTRTEMRIFLSRTLLRVHLRVRKKPAISEALARSIAVIQGDPEVFHHSTSRRIGVTKVVVWASGPQGGRRYWGCSGQSTAMGRGHVKRKRRVWIPIGWGPLSI